MQRSGMKKKEEERINDHQKLNICTARSLPLPIHLTHHLHILLAQPWPPLSLKQPANNIDMFSFSHLNLSSVCRSCSTSASLRSSTFACLFCLFASRSELSSTSCRLPRGTR